MVLALITACKKLDKLTQFEMTYKTQTTIKASVPINVPFDIITPPITTNSSKEFENNDTRSDLVEEIYLTSMTLSVVSPENGSLNFLKDIEIFISADGLPEKKIAWKYNIPENIGSTMELETANNEDLKEYIKKDKYSLRTKVTTDKILTQDYTIEITSKFWVNAKILGI